MVQMNSESRVKMWDHWKSQWHCFQPILSIAASLAQWYTDTAEQNHKWKRSCVYAISMAMVRWVHSGHVGWRDCLWMKEKEAYEKKNFNFIELTFIYLIYMLIHYLFFFLFFLLLCLAISNVELRRARSDHAKRYKKKTVMIATIIGFRVITAWKYSSIWLVCRINRELLITVNNLQTRSVTRNAIHN